MTYRMNRLRDNQRYCLNNNPNQPTSLQALAAKYLGIHVDKDLQRATYNLKPQLPKPLQQYAMGDAIIPLKIDDYLNSKFASSGITTPQHPSHLQPGAEVIIKLGGIAAAKAKIVVIGEHGGNGGESRMWGSLLIGAQKALVKIVSVLVPSAILPFRHMDWPGTERLTLEQAFQVSADKVVAIHARQIHTLATPSG